MIQAILIGLCALILHSAYMLPELCAWMVFIFLIPVFYLIASHRLTSPFRAGFFWGVLYFSLHFMGIALLLYEKAQGSLRLIAFVVLVTYFSLHAGIFFWLSHRLSYKKKVPARLMVWSAGFFIFFYWIVHFSFLPLGVMAGYCFGWPPVVLAQQPEWLWLIPYLGGDFVFILIIFLQASVVVALVKSSKTATAILVLLVFLFSFGWFLDRDTVCPSYLDAITYVSPPFKSMSNTMERAEEINMRIHKALNAKPSATCIIMPESSFLIPLNKCINALQLWGLNSLAQKITLCIGSCRADTHNEYNSLFIIRGCRITNYYDKSFLMPFAEYIPAVYKKITYIRNLFLKNITEFTPQKKSNKTIFLTKDLCIQPLICSDLYMAPYGTNFKSDMDYPILLTVNDSWFSMEYLKKIMFLFTVYSALKDRRDIFYVGHTYGCWISKNGKTKLF